MNLSEFGAIIDMACDMNNATELQTIITILSEYAENSDDSVDRVYSYYLLGNAWNGIKKLKHKENIDTVWTIAQDEVFQEIYYFRKAKLQKSFKDIDLTIQIAINVNLGNAFSHYGRTVNAIKYFNNAIGLRFFNKNTMHHPNFILANLNQALAFETYARLDYDPSHTFIFSQFAYKILQETEELLTSCLRKYKDDSNFYTDIKKNIQHKLETYSRHWDTDELEDLNFFQNYKAKYSTNEKKYREWCLQNKLFLNPLNDLGNYQIASHDPLSLPDLTTSIHKGFPKFITYFNQMKQEYITYRHLLYEGKNEKTSKFFDKETSIINDFDYNLYDLNIEKIKLAYRGFYSIFDKIAFFINEYFDIGLHETKVDFRKIWYNFGNRDKVPKIKSTFNQTENLALRGLYLISKDLFYSDEDSKEFLSVLEPEADKLSEIRHHLEHKLISIKVLDVARYETVRDRERNFYITEDDLELKTLHLAQLAREAMIYLSFAVHIQESQKSNDGMCMPMNLTTYK